MYVLSTLSVGGGSSIRWSQPPLFSRLLQSFPEKTAISADDSINVPVNYINP